MPLTPEEKAELLADLKEDLKQARAEGDTKEINELKLQIENLKEDLDKCKTTIQTVPTPAPPAPPTPPKEEPPKEEPKKRTLLQRIWGD